jgi:hypothetical protein
MKITTTPGEVGTNLVDAAARWRMAGTKVQAVGVFTEAGQHAAEAGEVMKEAMTEVGSHTAMEKGAGEILAATTWNHHGDVHGSGHHHGDVHGSGHYLGIVAVSILLIGILIILEHNQIELEFAGEELQNEKKRKSDIQLFKEFNLSIGEISIIEGELQRKYKGKKIETIENISILINNITGLIMNDFHSIHMISLIEGYIIEKIIPLQGGSDKARAFTKKEEKQWAVVTTTTGVAASTTAGVLISSPIIAFAAAVGVAFAFGMFFDYLYRTKGEGIELNWYSDLYDELKKKEADALGVNHFGTLGDIKESGEKKKDIQQKKKEEIVRYFRENYTYEKLKIVVKEILNIFNLVKSGVCNIYYTDENVENQKKLDTGFNLEIDKLWFNIGPLLENVEIDIKDVESLDDIKRKIKEKNTEIRDDLLGGNIEDFDIVLTDYQEGKTILEDYKNGLRVFYRKLKPPTPARAFSAEALASAQERAMTSAQERAMTSAQERAMTSAQERAITAEKALALSRERAMLAIAASKARRTKAGGSSEIDPIDKKYERLYKVINIDFFKKYGKGREPNIKIVKHHINYNCISAEELFSYLLDIYIYYLENNGSGNEVIDHMKTQIGKIQSDLSDGEKNRTIKKILYESYKKLDVKYINNIDNINKVVKIHSGWKMIASQMPNTSAKITKNSTIIKIIDLLIEPDSNLKEETKTELKKIRTMIPAGIIQKIKKEEEAILRKKFLPIWKFFHKKYDEGYMFYVIAKTQVGRTWYQLTKEEQEFWRELHKDKDNNFTNIPINEHNTAMTEGIREEIQKEISQKIRKKEAEEEIIEEEKKDLEFYYKHKNKPTDSALWINESDKERKDRWLEIEINGDKIERQKIIDLSEDMGIYTRDGGGNKRKKTRRKRTKRNKTRRKRTKRNKTRRKKTRRKRTKRNKTRRKRTRRKKP